MTKKKEYCEDISPLDAEMFTVLRVPQNDWEEEWEFPEK